jgi:hypothetical protein
MRQLKRHAAPTGSLNFTSASTNLIALLASSTRRRAPIWLKIDALAV